MGSYQNVAVVTPEITTDPISINNTSLVTSEVGTNADLAIVKTHTGPSTPGEPTTFSLRVTNFGPSDAATVTIVDTLPAGLTYAGFSDVRGNWSCALTTAPQFRCDLLASSLPLRFTTDSTVDNVEVSIEVDSAADLTGQTVTNTAEVSSTTPDGNLDNNDDTANVTFVGVADLALTKTSSGTAVPGADVTWTIDVENLGPSDSLAPITVTDALPAGMARFVSAAGVAAGDWDCTTTDVLVTCVKNSTLAAGASSEITVVGTTDPTVGGPATITNSATVTPTTGEGQNATENNTDTDIVTLIEPDVAIAKSVDDVSPEPGDTFEYTVALTNDGPAPAFDLVVSDDVPTGIAVVASSISAAGTLTGTTAVGGVSVGGTITWNLPGPLAPGATVELTYSAQLAPSSTIDTDPITNVASLDGYESLPTGGRPYTGGDVEATVTPRFPELTISKEPLGAVPTYIGDEFGWSVTVTNAGDGDAALVSLTDTLPPNWSFVTGSAVVTAPGPVGGVQPALSTVGTPPVVTLTWDDLGPLAPGQSLTVTIRTIPTTAVVDAPASVATSPTRTPPRRVPRMQQGRRATSTTATAAATRPPARSSTPLTWS
jgi:large repetitive protein